jgi:signal transduction histidine kinase
VPVSTVNLESELNAAIDQFSAEIEANHAEIQVSSPIPPVKANAAVLNQILSNLLSNALKFVKPGVQPRIRIRAEDVIRKAEPAESRGTRSLDTQLYAFSGPFVRLWIEDNGIGIQPEYHERIFRMFERLHGADSFPGTGIGLAIVRKAVERMGGRVGVESEPGKGSRFWVELPAA